MGNRVPRPVCRTWRGRREAHVFHLHRKNLRAAAENGLDTRGSRLNGMAGRERSRAKRYIYGVNPVLEAVRSRATEIERLYGVEAGASSPPAAGLGGRARAVGGGGSMGMEVEPVASERAAAMSQGGAHQGLVAQLRPFQYASLEDLLSLASGRSSPLLLVVLDGIQDPHNLGAIIRSAHALGAHGVVIPKDRSAPVTAAVATAAAGA